MIVHGTRITFTVKGVTGYLLPRNVESVRGIVIDGLTPYLDVISVSFDTNSILSDPFHSLSNWPYTAHVTAITRVDHGDIRDIDSIVANAFYNAAGEVPTVTADGIEAPQADNTQAGISLGTGIGIGGVVVAALAIVALVVFIKVS